MTTDDIIGCLEEFRELRLSHESARKYTVEHNGELVNAGLFRDSMADVLEELSDAHNITNIALDRLMREAPNAPDRLTILRNYLNLLDMIEDAMELAACTRTLLPPDLAFDNPFILRDKTPKRIVTLSELGL